MLMSALMHALNNWAYEYYYAFVEGECLMAIFQSETFKSIVSFSPTIK